VTRTQFLGDFETHVTVHCDTEGDGEDRARALRAWAAAASGVKFTHVVLARGRVRSQPMLTLTGSGTLDQQMAAAAELVTGLECGAPGCTVTRVKVEAAPWTSGVPRTDAEAALLGIGYYFEHHIKILCREVDLESLAALVVPHDAHLSWNARRVRGDGISERFVTQRCYGVGDASAVEALTRLRSALADDGREIVSAEREYVVYDSDASLDEGWIRTVGRH
jgi:hypothetical protein